MTEPERDLQWAIIWCIGIHFVDEVRSTCPLYWQGECKQSWRYLQQMTDGVALILDREREVHRIRGTSNNSINKYQAYIRAILAWGVDQALIHNNPWRDYKLLKTTRPVIKVIVEDLKKLYQFLPEYMQWAVKTPIFLALRPGLVELFGLTWDAFNWSRGMVLIRQGKSGKIKMVIPHSII